MTSKQPSMSQSVPVDFPAVHSARPLRPTQLSRLRLRPPPYPSTQKQLHLIRSYDKHLSVLSLKEIQTNNMMFEIDVFEEEEKRV